MTTYAIDKQYAALLAAAGIEAGECLRRAGVPTGLFEQEHPALTASEYYAFIRSVGEMLNPKMALPMATAQENLRFSPVIFVAWCSPNMRVCLSRLATYKRLVAPMAIGTMVGDGAFVVTYDSLLPEEPLPLFLAEMEITFLLSLLRKATRSDIVPLEITMPEPSRNADLLRYWQCRPTAGPQTRIVLSEHDSLLSFHSEDSTVWSFYEPELRSRLMEQADENVTKVERKESSLSLPRCRNVTEGNALSANVRCALLELLPLGYCTAAHVATHLCLSQRTLQRRLADESTTFQQQLDATRLRLSRYYIDHSNLTSDEIAFLLGYEEANTFRRAFARWTGAGLREYKSQGR